MRTECIYVIGCEASTLVKMRGRGRATAWHTTARYLTVRRTSTQSDEKPTTREITQHLS